MPGRIKEFFVRCLRVWHITRKPTMKEFKDISKVSAIGIAIIGLIGFIISMVVKTFI